MESEEKYISRINFLEKENHRLREELMGCSLLLHAMVERLPFPAVAVDGSGRIICSSPLFDKLPGVQIYGDKKTTGQELKAYIPQNIYGMIINSALGDEDIVNSLVDMNGHKISLSVYNIKKGDIALCFMRDAREKDVANEETVIRIKESIDRQMAMVQKIGFLLGEEVSEISKNLDSVIKIIDNGKNGR